MEAEGEMDKVAEYKILKSTFLIFVMGKFLKKILKIKTKTRSFLRRENLSALKTKRDFKLLHML